MPTGYPAPLGKWIAFTNVAPGALAGGTVQTFQNRTSTPYPTYTNASLTVANSNPVLLDSAGRASIFIPDASVMTYTFVVRDVLGVIVYTENDISIPVIPPPPSTAGMGIVVPGSIVPYAGSSAPTSTSANAAGKQISDYVLCDGTSLNRIDYERLFAIIGTTFGYVDGSTMKVPDLRQRFPLGVAVSGDAGTLGHAAGEFDHRHTGAVHSHPIPAHRHGMNHNHAVFAYGWKPTITQSPSVAREGTLQVVPASFAGNASETQVTMVDTASTPKIASEVSSEAETQDKAIFSTDTVTPGLSGTNNPPYLCVNFIIKT